tara:strand:+ start:403 stop:546 length:144 start_codon:yes stop_codon:yes gene_type:complete
MNTKKTNAKRVELERSIIKLLKEELTLKKRKLDLYKQYEKLIKHTFI